MGTEWRNFSDENGHTDQSRVGAAEDSLFSGGDLSTMMWGHTEEERR